MRISATTPDGEPTPARVVIVCADDCPGGTVDSRERDAHFSPPNGWVRVVALGVDGRADIALAPGNYRVSVNRGMTYSTWPPDATASRGFVVSLGPGEVEALAAEIAKVVDTRGVLGADFHVHAMASMDSHVSDRDRVLDLMAGGLDVMVSSDHDAVTDFAPTIAALGAERHIQSIVGSEITTSGLGHVNAFPLQRDVDARKGGPVDWTTGDGLQLTLSGLVDVVRAYPGEQVIQLNHPSAPMGAIGLLEVDVLTGRSFATPQSLRMPPTDTDAETGDTRLWSEGFDAIEIYNGFSLPNFWGYLRWWLAMVGRGFSPTATAVTDTHTHYGSLGAAPRSFVFVGDSGGDPGTFDLPRFVDRVRAGAVVGSNGPFMRVEVENSAGIRAGIAETLDVTEDGLAAVHVTLELPEWIDVDTLDIFVNIPAEGLVGAPGVLVTTPVEATVSLPVVWDDSHRALVAEGVERHYRLRQTLDIPLALTTDSYLVVVAHGHRARSMGMVVGRGVRPLAFSNPIFFDADGGGYDKPPNAASMRTAAGDASASANNPPLRATSPVMIPRGVWPTPGELGRLIEALSCKHEDASPGGPHHHHGSGSEGHR